MTNFILKEMEYLDADGVDFINIGDKLPFRKIYLSVTKQDLEQNKITTFPKTNRAYWTMKTGKKEYIDIGL